MLPVHVHQVSAVPKLEAQLRVNVRHADDSEGAIDSAASRACKATMRPRQVKGDSNEGECAHGGNGALHDHPII